MRADHSVGVLPDLGHRVHVSGLERLVEGRVGRSDLGLGIDDGTLFPRVPFTVTPAVHNRCMALEPPRTLSPSKVAAFTDCALAFRFATIDRLPEPPSPWATKGTLVHAALERLFLLPPAERTVAAALTCLDAAFSGLR